MKLKKLLQSITVEEVRGSRDVEITGITSDSRIVAPGNLFVARKGELDDGSHYIGDALNAGAAAIATDLADPSLRIPQLISRDLRKLESNLAAALYNHPSKELFCVGVTGTNGKTSTTFLIKHLFDHLGSPCGLIGSIEYIIGPFRQSASHTTPDAATSQKLLREMVMQGCKAATLEVSSHGLAQERMTNIDFDVGIFTNFSQDHLDYHKTMEAYLAAKKTLFAQSKHALINADDGAVSIDGALTYGIDSGDLRAEEITLSSTGSTFIVSYQDQRIPCQTPLIGRFNIYNCLAAIGAGLLYGYPLHKLCPLLASAPSIRGRLERVPNPQNLQIFVDFAHTPDALSNVLTTLKSINTGKIITVFGCGGDRDRSKRGEMGHIASTLSDHTIVTSDNPRTEDPQSICDQISANISADVIVDRKAAIERAISLATPQDIVLIAGKGHETTQIIGTRRIPFDDRKIAEAACAIPG